MDIVLIFNGLGNQMSQYAFYLAKKKHTPNCVAIYNTKEVNTHNGYELGRLFGINCDRGLKHFFYQSLYRLSQTKRIPFLRKILTGTVVKTIVEAKNYDFNPKLLDQYPSIGFNYFWGGWHSEKNFMIIKDEIKTVFRFPQVKDERCLRFVDLINNTENSVSIHIRRGDYLNISPNDYYQFGGVATPDYYKKGIRTMQEMFSDCVFFIFSNDPNWCKQEFKELKCYVVDCNSGKDSWLDMYLMTLCKHHINANSTFSWWGAWLSDKEGVTICPSKFIRNVETKDFYPEEWIKISV